MNYLILAGAAFLAGAMNAMAGGGSFLTFPALLALQVPPINANATNTVALWPGQIASLLAFRSEIGSIRSLWVPAAISAAIGGMAGALALLLTPQRTFVVLVPWLLLFATLLFAVSDPVQKWLRRNAPARQDAAQLSPSLFISLTLVTSYIGYFGAGAGFLCIALFSLYGVGSLNRINLLKIICTSVANGVACTAFIVARAVYWRECAVMIVGAILGGYLGAALSRRMNPGILKAFIVLTGLSLTIYYFRN